MAHPIEQIQLWISQNVGGWGGFIFFVLTFALPSSVPSFHGHYWFNVWVLVLIAGTSAMLGWGIGIFLTPIGVQVKSANLLVSAVTSFWTGVIVSHIESVGRTLLGFVNGKWDQSLKVRLLFGVGLFLMSLFVTVNSRFPEAHPYPALLKRRRFSPPQ
jgi:hypothetical protein